MLVFFNEKYFKNILSCLENTNFNIGENYKSTIPI